MALKDALQAVGFGTPFVFAAATYGFFYWLDRNASAQATRAVSLWLKGQAYRRFDVGSGIIDAFDRLYSSPLLHVKAFLRSALVSIAFFIIILHSYIIIPLISIDQYNILYFKFVIQFLFAAILSDYLSLFVVRGCLVIARGHILASLALAAAAGSCIITASFVTITLIQYFLSFSIWELKFQILENFARNSFDYFISQLRYSALFLLPALFVHLWLPLFAVAALGVRVLYPIFRAVEWAQWFLKQGSRHPLRAIGMVAAVIVFAVTTIGKALAAS